MSIFKNEGTFILTLDSGVDLTDATLTEIIYEKPDGTKGAFDQAQTSIVTLTKIKFEATNSDLDQIGIWNFQAHWTIDSIDGFSEVESSDIVSALNAPDLTLPFQTILDNEIPIGLIVSSTFQTIVARKWRALLLSKSNVALVDATELDPDTGWPLLYKYLIAKLVVYDYMLKVVKGTTGGDGVKRIETGPSNVEFFDPFAMLKLYGGPDAVGALKSDICELASNLGLYLLLCGPRKVPVIPKKQGLPCPPNLLNLLSRYY